MPPLKYDLIIPLSKYQYVFILLMAIQVIKQIGKQLRVSKLLCFQPFLFQWPNLNGGSIFDMKVKCSFSNHLNKNASAFPNKVIKFPRYEITKMAETPLSPWLFRRTN